MAAFSSLDIARPHGRHALLRLLVFIAGLALILVGLAPQAHAAAPSGGSTLAAADSTPYVAGLVTDQVTGSPLAGVTVIVSQPERANPEPDRTTTTAGDGSYRVDGLTVGEAYAVLFKLEGTDYLPEAWPNAHSWSSWQGVNPQADGSTAHLDVALDHGAVVTGRVFDPSGQPLPNICIDVYASDSGDFASDSGCTGADGSYRLVSLPGVELWLSASDTAGFYLSNATPDGAPVVLTAGQVRTGVDFHLTLGGYVTGRVVDASGNPIAGICVGLWDPQGWPLGGRQSCTDAAGRYSSPGAATGTYLLEFNSETESVPPQFFGGVYVAANATPVTITAPDPTNLPDYTVLTGGSITGVAHDGSTGAPIANACASASPTVWGPGATSGSACSGGDGHLTISGLVPGDYIVSVTGPNGSDYAMFTSPGPVTVTEGSTVGPLDLPLAGGGSISGMVTTTVGGPVLSSVCVTAWAPVPGAWWPQQAGSACTDPTGRYVIHGLAVGTYYLSAMGTGVIGEWYDNAQGPFDGTLVAVAAGSSTTVDFQLELAHSLYIRASGDSGPVAGLEVTGYPVSGGSPIVFGTTGVDGTLVADVTDSTGLKVGVHDPQGRYADWFAWSATTLELADIVYLSPGGQTWISPYLTHIPQGDSISGHVTDSAGNGLAAMLVTAYDSMFNVAGSTTTGADGAFTIAGLTAGNYTVQFGRSGEMWVPQWWDNQPDQWSATVLAVAGPMTDIDAHLVKARYAVSGTVTDARSSAAVVGATVTISSVIDQSLLATTTTDSAGHYEATIEAGLIRVKVTPADESYRETWYVNGTSPATAEVLFVGSAMDSVNVALPRLPKLTGTVTDSVTGSPVAGVTVSATLVGGSAAAATTTTGADGSYVILGLAAGSYVVTFDDGSGPYLTEYSGGVYSLATATPISLTSSAPWQTADDALDKPGTITGTVVGKLKDNKDPVCVQVWSSATQAVGTPVCVTQGTAYTIAGLLPGTYRVSGTLKKGETTWYAAATSYATATPVVVGSGATVTGIDVEAKPKTK